MNSWRDKRVILGVTGSIAAYKACELASRLVEYGAEVRAVVTQSAAEFVAPCTFEAITGNPAYTSLFEAGRSPDIDHINVTQQADLFLIAPATANVLAKAAHGIADDWHSTALLAARAPVLFAPAMNADMYEHPATQANIALLKERGCHFVGPGSGRLACRTVGSGRLIEPETILETGAILVSGKQGLRGKHVLLTCGGTREAIDPVRFISNHSSGKMGRALAFEGLLRQARVTVVAGPMDVPLPYGVDAVAVESATEMAAEVASRLDGADVFISAAAVADYRPAHSLQAKHKKKGAPLRIELVENPDILAYASAHRRDGQVLAGFAAETENIVENGREKLLKKRTDIMVANLVGPGHVGFGADSIEAVLLCAAELDEGHNVASASRETEMPQAYTKEELASLLFDRIEALLSAPADSARSTGVCSTSQAL